MSYACARRLVLELSDTPVPVYILRPEGMSESEWHDFHCAELSRMRQERNSRGERAPLNRGRVEWDRVRVLRG